MTSQWKTKGSGTKNERQRIEDESTELDSNRKVWRNSTTKRFE